MAGSKKRYEAEYVMNLNKTMATLQKAQKQAEAFDDIMSNIGDRGNLNELIKYFLGLDNIVDELRQSTDGLLSELGDSLKGGYIKSLDNVFGKLADISSMTRSLLSDAGALDLADPNAAKNLEQMATQLNEVFKAFNINKRINLKNFLSKPLEDQRERIVQAMKTLNKDINTTLGSINFGNIQGEVEDALGSAGIKFEDFSDEVQNAIKKLEKQNDALVSLQKELKNTAKMLNEVKSNASEIPDEYKLDAKSLKVNKVLAWTEQYDELDKQMKSGSLSAEEYANTLIELTDVTMKLRSAFSLIKADEALKSMFSKAKNKDNKSLYGLLAQQASNTTALISRVSKSVENDDIGKLIAANNERIERIKQDAIKNLGGGTGGLGGTSDALNDIEKKLKEIDKLVRELDDYNFDDPEYEKLEDKIESLKNSFIELYNIQDEDQIGSLDDLGVDDETTQEIIANFKEIVSLAKDVNDAIGSGTGAGSGGSNIIIDADKLKNDLSQIHDLALQTEKELSFSISANGVDYVVESMEGMVKISDEAATAVNSLNSGLTILAHSHPDGNGYFSVADFTSALNAKAVGVNSPMMAMGKDMASVLNLDGVTDEVLSKIKAKLGSLSGDDVITPKLLKEIKKIFESGGFSDALNTFNISDDMDDLSIHLKKIGENATGSIDPLEKFQSLIMYYSDGKVNKNNLSSFGTFWDDFNSGAKSALEIFDALMAKVGAVDTDGNLLKINTEGYKSLAVAAKNITVGERGGQGGSGSGDGVGGVDDEEIEKANKLLEIINKIKIAVDEKTDAFKKEKEFVNESIPDEVKVLDDLYVKVKDVEDKLTNIINLDTKAIDFNSWVEELNNVLEALDKLNADFSNINSALGNLNTNFNDVVDKSASADSKQVQVNNMKQALSQLLQMVTEHNNKQNQNVYNQQELSAQFLSNGSIALGYGENGSVNWNTTIEAMMSDLSHALIMDVHSHPWSEYITKNLDFKKFSNDTFSGSFGDLSAFRVSKQFGAQLASMITGNIMHVFDIGKISSDMHDSFVDHLRDIEKEYGQHPEYSKYVGYDDDTGMISLNGQRTLEGRHEQMRVFKQMMLEALSRTGFSNEQISDIYKEYNLKDDAQLTSLASTLVELSNAAGDASSPIDRLKDILTVIGKSHIRGSAMDSLFEANNAGTYIEQQMAYDEVVRNIKQYAGNKYDNELDEIDTTFKDYGMIYEVFDKLYNIVSNFGTDIESKQGETALEGIRKGELSVAEVFNQFQDRFPQISQETIDNLKKIDIANEDTREMKALSSIVNTLNSIDSKLGTIEKNTYKNINEQFESAVYSLAELKGENVSWGKDNQSSYFYAPSAVDSHNVSEYKAQELYTEADSLFDAFLREVADLTQDLNAYGDVDITKVKDLLDQFALALTRVEDAQIQLGLYEDRYNTLLVNGDDGDLLSSKLEYMSGKLLSDANLDRLLNLATASKQAIDTAINGINVATFDDDDDDISSGGVTKEAIYNLNGYIEELVVVLRGILSKIGNEDNFNSRRYYGDPQETLDYQNVIDSIDISSESDALNNLIITLSSVVRMVNAKTTAFRNEADAVDVAIAQEIATLSRLETYLQTLKVLIDSLFNGTNVSSISFDAWKQDLSIIEANVKNILDYFIGIQNAISGTNFNTPVTNGAGLNNTAPSSQKNGDYALETTLQGTNSILELIFDTITTDDNNNLANALTTATQELQNAANGIVSHQKSQKADTRAASDRISDLTTYKQISDISRNFMSSFGDVEIDGLTALKDGVVKVEGAFKNAQGIWEGFSVKVNESNELVDLATKKQSSFAKALNEANNATPKVSGAKNSIKGLQEKYYALSGRAEKYVSDTSNIYSSAVKTKLDEYTKALENLKTAQQELKDNTQNLTQEQLDKNFAKAKDECNQYARALTKLIDSHEKFASTHGDVIAVDRDEYNVDNIDDARRALEDYVTQQYGATAKVGSFDQANKELNFTLRDTDGNLRRLIASFDATGTAIGSAVDKTKQSTTLLDKVGVKAGQLFTYFSARFGIDELFQQVRNGIQYVREIDGALTELKKVTDETDASYKRFLQDMSKTADVIGSTVSELTTMSAEWARLGYSMKEAGQLAESTAILLNVSEFKDANEASEALISTMQAFQYTADESQHVVDVLNEVGNNFAVSSDGLATALQDSASALVEGGNNLEQAVALVAAANKVVQDPNSVGSALRTISLRLRGTSVEVLEEMGEETDGVVSSVSKMQEKIRALTGVDIVGMNGAYKDTYTILQEIGTVWEDMYDIDQAALLELMAGKNRANTLAAILGNMKDLEGAYKSAMNAEGSALRENEAYLDSIQGRIDIFNNALQTFWMNFIDSSVVKGFVDTGTTIINILDTWYGKIIALVGGLAVYERVKNKVAFADMFTGAVDTIKGVVGSVKSMIDATKSVTAATIEQTIKTQTGNEILARRIVTTAGVTGATGALTKEQIKATAATATAAFKNGELSASQYLATMSTMGLKTALVGLGNVLKTNPIYAIAAVVAGAALAIDAFTTTVQEAADETKDAFDKIQNVLESTKYTIQSLESELSSIKDKIDELDGKKLSFAEEQELERLEKQKKELEHSKKIQEQLLELQKKSSNEQAVASMKAYTKAASQGAKETQETAKTWGTIVGAVAGVAGVLLAPITGGVSLGAVVAAGAAGGFIGNKAGEVIGSSMTENDGTYDDWYETYTKALETARKDEQNALDKYKKDSSDIDKLDKWQEAQQKTTDIENEMYEHLSQMQQYYSGLEYGVSDEIDKELDTWYNFLDKLSISEGASGAEVTALDRIFGENASEEIQSIKEQVLKTIDAGQEFAFESAINGSEELKNTLGYVGLSAEDVKNYFTQVGEAIAESAREITAFKSYSYLSADAENYKEILLQSNEILAEGITVTEDYYNALIELGVSEDTLGECIDKNNGFMVTNVDLLQDIVKETSKGIAADVKLAKSQSMLKYYDLYKQMYQLSKGSGQLTGATLDQVNALYEQMNAIEKTIAKYSMLEQQLLGAGNAFTAFENAQSLDEQTDYISSAENMVLALGEAFNTAELGTETEQAAIAGLVPESVYEDLDTVDEKMSAIYDYFKTGKLAQYFDIQFDEDGAIESAEMKLGNLRKFIEDGLANNTFGGDDWQHFEFSDEFLNGLNKLPEGTDKLQYFADQMDVTKDVAFAFIKSLEDHDIEWLKGDYSTLFDSLLPDSLSSDITDTISSLADFEYRLANGKMSAEDYSKAMYGLDGQLRLGAITQEQYNNCLDILKQKLDDNEITLEEYEQAIAGVSGYSAMLAENAREEAAAWYTKTEKLEEYKNQLKDYYSQLESGKDSEGNEIDVEQVQKNIDETVGYINTLTGELAKLEEPTEVTLQVAMYEVDKDLQEITDKIGEVVENTHYKFDVEASEYKVILDTNDPNYQEVVNYVGLLNEKHTLSLQMGEGTPTVVDQLSNIAGILEKITGILAKTYGIDIETGEALEQTNTFKSLWDSIKSKGVTLWTTVKETFSKPTNTTNNSSRPTRVNGSAHATGDWGLPKAEKNSLVGELGQELVVDPHSGRYYTVGDRGAEFVDLPKDAIIFNHKQTEDLLSHGYVTGRGKAYAEGNAHVTIFDDGSSKNQWRGTGYSSGDDPTWDAADALSGAAGDISDAAKESIDFIEIKLEEIESEISKVTASLVNYVDDTSAEYNKSKQYNSLVNAEKDKANTYRSAYSVYNQKATSLLNDIPQQYRTMAQNGAIAIADFVEESEAKIAKSIQEYRDWANKADEAKVSELEAIARIEELRLEQFNDLADDYDNRISIIEDESSLINAQMELLEARGERLSENYYKELIKNTNETISELEDKRARMQKDLNNAVSSGDIKKGSDSWYEMVNAIADVDEEIIQCSVDIEEFQNSINDLKWEALDKLIAELDHIDSQLSHLHNRFTDDDVVDDDGKWTDNGIAAMGVLAQQMELAKIKSQQYADAIDELQKDYERGLYSTDEYNEKLAELTENQWDSIEAYEDAKDAIVDLNKTRIEAVKEGIEKEIDAYKELIDKKKELLDADKDLYDFEKSVAEQQKEIATIERKIAALSNDTSASAAAQRKELEEELLKANASLEETYYERSIENQKNALDKEAADFEEAKNAEMEALDKWLENEETVILESMQTVKANTEVVLSEIDTISEQYGVEISTSITQPWKDGSSAIDDYKNKFSELASSFAKAVDDIIAQQNRLQNAVNNSANNALSFALNATNNAQNGATGGSGGGGGGGSANQGSSSGGINNGYTWSPFEGGTVYTNGEFGWGNNTTGVVDFVGDMSDVTQTLNRGDTGDDVKRLQQALNNNGYKLDVDGSFGPATQSAVEQYQKDNGLKVDGIVGPETRNEIIRDKEKYAKGTIGVSDSDWAWIDEIGEELVLHAGSNGKLAYLTKGTSVIPADLTSKLMDIAVDPTQTLEASRPVINAPHITNNEINIDMSFGSVVNIEHVDQSDIPDLTKTIEKQMDKYMKNLNSQIRKYSR